VRRQLDRSAEERVCDHGSHRRRNSGLGRFGLFRILTEGSEPNRHDALVPGRELCFEDYAPPRATSSTAKSSEESPQEKINKIVALS
jgi:hypothetical protein